jgi:hypothetical protein
MAFTCSTQFRIMRPSFLHLAPVARLHQSNSKCISLAASRQSVAFWPHGGQMRCESTNRERGTNRGTTQMSDERTAIYGPEELSLLGTIFDQAVASLPATMQTQANRTEIAKIVMDRAAAGERELLPLMRFAVAAGS